MTTEKKLFANGNLQLLIYIAVLVGGLTAQYFMQRDAMRQEIASLDKTVSVRLENHEGRIITLNGKVTTLEDKVSRIERKPWNTNDKE